MEVNCKNVFTYLMKMCKNDQYMYAHVVSNKLVSVWHIENINVTTDDECNVLVKCKVGTRLTDSKESSYVKHVKVQYINIIIKIV